jgi:mRNA interferase MazF
VPVEERVVEEKGGRLGEQLSRRRPLVSELGRQQRAQRARRFVPGPGSPGQRLEERGDLVTSNPYGDPVAVPLTSASFTSGGLGRDSFARPGKLFTASESLVVRVAGALTSSSHRELVGRVVSVLQAGVG